MDDLKALKARCVHCKQPYDKHIPDMDAPNDPKRKVCPEPPRKAERYSPDTEHREMTAAICALEAKVAERDAALLAIEYAPSAFDGGSINWCRDKAHRARTTLAGKGEGV